MSIGRNIRFSEGAFETLKNYCKMNGYKLGQFCETAALDKIKSQLSGLINLSQAEKVMPAIEEKEIADKARGKINLSYTEQRRQSKLK